MAKNEKAIVRVIAKENDIISIKLDEENSGDIDEIIMLGKVLAHEVEENSENWDYDLVQEAKSITRKINNSCM